MEGKLKPPSLQTLPEVEKARTSVCLPFLSQNLVRPCIWSPTRHSELSEESVPCCSEPCSPIWKRRMLVPALALRRCRGQNSWGTHHYGYSHITSQLGRCHPALPQGPEEPFYPGRAQKTTRPEDQVGWGWRDQRKEGPPGRRR